MDDYGDHENQENQTSNHLISGKTKNTASASENVLLSWQMNHTQTIKAHYNEPILFYYPQVICKPDMSFEIEKPRLNRKRKQLETFEGKAGNEESVKRTTEKCFWGMTENEEREFVSSSRMNDVQAVRSHYDDATIQFDFQKELSNDIDDNKAHLNENRKPFGSIEERITYLKNTDLYKNMREYFCPMDQNESQSSIGSCASIFSESYSSNELQYDGNISNSCFENSYSLSSCNMFNIKECHSKFLETPKSNQIDAKKSVNRRLFASSLSPNVRLSPFSGIQKIHDAEAVNKTEQTPLGKKKITLTPYKDRASDVEIVKDLSIETVKGFHRNNNKTNNGKLRDSFLLRRDVYEFYDSSYSDDSLNDSETSVSSSPELASNDFDDSQSSDLCEMTIAMSRLTIHDSP